MTHPLSGFVEAKETRDRCITYTVIDGVKHYYTGFGEHSTDRDAAIRYNSGSKVLEQLVLNGHKRELV